MKLKLVSIFAAFACVFAAHSLRADDAAKHTFAIGTNDFLLDGQRFQIRCGEIHAARVPGEYWRHRLQMAKAMGLNTVCAYLFWNMHEPKPGRVQLERTGRRRGILPHRAGGRSVGDSAARPVCLRRMGNGRHAVVAAQRRRHQSPPPRSALHQPVKTYLKEVGRVLAPLQITHGGPIIMAQVENEYGFYGKDAGIHGRSAKGLDGRGF